MTDEKETNVISLDLEGAKAEIPVRQLAKGRRSSKDLQSIADEVGVCPFTILLQAAAGDYEALGYSDSHVQKRTPAGDAYMEEILPASLRIAAAKEAAQYLHAKKRAVELSGDNEKDPINLQFNGDVVELIKLARG